MEKAVVYKSDISAARWLIYDIPGNAGWIMYIAVLIRLGISRPGFVSIPLVSISMIVGILPAMAMLVGIAELISERILKMDRVLSKKRLYRGFGALTWGGFAGGMVGGNALAAGMRGGYSLKECRLLVLLFIGGMLCAVFAGLILKTFHPTNEEV
ncbi:MAG: hypothetical protein IJ418_22240 [Clostridia bacterium]|nr:hypothetical protein [Clostridia bacterium]